VKGCFHQKGIQHFFHGAAAHAAAHQKQIRSIFRDTKLCFCGCLIGRFVKLLPYRDTGHCKLGIANVFAYEFIAQDGIRDKADVGSAVADTGTAGIVCGNIRCGNIQTIFPLLLRYHHHEQRMDTKQLRNVDKFIRQAKKYLHLEKLTPAVLNDLVKAVYVHAPDNSSGHRVQDVEISYNYIGILPATLLYDLQNGKTA